MFLTPAPFLAAFCLLICFVTGSNASLLLAGSQAVTQGEIEAQRQRLSATDPEERRDALMKLGLMRRANASRAALPGLTDVSPMVRAVAAKAILSLAPDECVAALLPLTTDKDEFVRREAAYAMGLTRSRTATAPLTSLLVNDKEDGVRAAAAVALGNLGDETAVVTLAKVLSQEPTTAKAKQREKNIFVLRAVARSLGKIKSKAAVPALIAALSNEKLVEDVRREAASALGLIGDTAAVPALRIAANSGDPYLAQAASESLRKITP